jgi:hypothetical protein
MGKQGVMWMEDYQRPWVEALQAARADAAARALAHAAVWQADPVARMALADRLQELLGARADLPELAAVLRDDELPF